MNSLAQILALYEEIDRAFDFERKQARDDGDRAATERIENRKILNDQAYFVLCWGQLEYEIGEACRSLIRRRRESADWELRRGFDIYDPDDRRLSGLVLERRIALVLDRNAGSDSQYGKTLFHYAVRNRIAHGRLEAKRIDVVRVVEDFYVIQSAIQR